MIESVYLDVAIGIVLVWFVLSLAVSGLHELTVRVFMVRSKHLWSGLNQMLDGKADVQVAFVRALWPASGKRPRGVPSMFEEGTGTQEVGAGSLTDQLYGTASVATLDQRPTDTSTRIDHIPAAVFSQALVELGLREGRRTVAGIVDALPDGPARKQLEAIDAQVQGDMVAFTARVEQWFDAEMARLGQAYKQMARVRLSVLGLLVAFVGFLGGVRTDAFALYRDLQADADLRASFTSAATAFVERGGDLCAEEDGDDEGGEPEDELAELDSVEQLGCARDLLGEAGLDDALFVGAPALSCDDDGEDAGRDGGSSGAGEAQPAPTCQTWCGRLGDLWPASPGVLATGIAVGFGSTFWFDVLKRLVGIRKGNTPAT